MAYKYVIFEIQGDFVPVIFPDVLYHDKVSSKLDYDKIISAGYVTFENGKPKCYGKSTGLHISSREEKDNDIISSFL